MEKEGENKISKKKISGGTIFLIIVLILIGIFAVIYIIADESELKYCNSTNECEIYNVYTFGGEKSVCMNNQKEEGSFKDKLLMFKYNIKYGQKEELIGCVCENQECIPAN